MMPGPPGDSAGPRDSLSRDHGLTRRATGKLESLHHDRGRLLAAACAAGGRHPSPGLRRPGLAAGGMRQPRPIDRQPQPRPVPRIEQDLWLSIIITITMLFGEPQLGLHVCFECYPSCRDDVMYRAVSGQLGLDTT